jgi:hypothetical protein
MGHDPAGLCDATRYAAPLVIDVGDPAQASAAATLADAVVLVASPTTEPALAAVVSESLSRVGPAPVVVINRSDGAMSERAPRAVHLPEARMGAWLTLMGHEPRGDLGRSLGQLANLGSRPP